MRSKKWHGVLLYLGILGASSVAFGLRTLPAAQSSTAAASSSAPSSTARPQDRSSATAKPPTAKSPTAKSPTAKPPTTRPSTAAAVTVTGAASSTEYGPVQVAVQFLGSTIVDVQALQTPNGDGRSIQIANRAVPTLHDEVIRSQSAQIDTVSGATYTSEGYAASVQSAIDQHP